MPSKDTVTRREKLDRALALTDAAGIGRGHSMPPFFRLMAARGWPVRPLHYRSVLWLMVYHLAVIGSAGTLILGPYLTGLLRTPAIWPLQPMVQHGWLGVAAMALFVAVVTTVSVRRQARRAGLPPWDRV